MLTVSTLTPVCSRTVREISTWYTARVYSVITSPLLVYLEGTGHRLTSAPQRPSDRPRLPCDHAPATLMTYPTRSILVLRGSAVVPIFREVTKLRYSLNMQPLATASVNLNVISSKETSLTSLILRTFHV